MKVNGKQYTGWKNTVQTQRKQVLCQPLTWGAETHERSHGLGPTDTGPMLTMGAKPMMPPRETQFTRPSVTCGQYIHAVDEARLSRITECNPGTTSILKFNEGRVSLSYIILAPCSCSLLFFSLTTACWKRINPTVYTAQSQGNSSA